MLLDRSLTATSQATGPRKITPMRWRGQSRCHRRAPARPNPVDPHTYTHAQALSLVTPSTAWTLACTLKPSSTSDEPTPPPTPTVWIYDMLLLLPPSTMKHLHTAARPPTTPANRCLRQQGRWPCTGRSGAAAPEPAAGATRTLTSNTGRPFAGTSFHGCISTKPSKDSTAIDALAISRGPRRPAKWLPDNMPMSFNVKMIRSPLGTCRRHSQTTSRPPTTQAGKTTLPNNKTPTKCPSGHRRGLSNCHSDLRRCENRQQPNQ